MPQPSHVALLVPSVEKAAAHLRSLGFEPGPAEIFEGEGTKEIYVGYGLANSLLLMEPCKPGSYQNALNKRGPGLHHIAIDVEKLDAFLASLAGSGWLLHLNSVATMAKTRTAYLARPGFPGLIEVQEKAGKAASSHFVSGIELPLPPNGEKLLAPLGLAASVKNGTELKLQMGSRSVSLRDLL